MGRLASFPEEIADRFYIAAEAMGDVPRVTMSGRRRVCVENHGGILRYSPELIELGGRTRIIIRGDDLHLVAMNRRDMVIDGRILSAEFE
jgi:sporulation protein YqfC